MSKVSCAISFFLLALAIGQAFPEEKMEDSRPVPPESHSNEIIVSGKLFCPIKRKIVMPYHCTIISFNAYSGKQVKAGEVLARYRLEPEAALKLHQRASSFEIKDLEMKLIEANNKMSDLEDKYEEIKQLSAQDMAPSQSLIQIERDIELLNKKREYIQERLPLERELAEEELSVIRALLGNTVRHGYVSREGVLEAPIGGHVIWVHPDLRKDAEFKKGVTVFSIGVLDPIIIRAQVHEIEALQIKLGDKAEFTLESVPGRIFEATVSRISWEPVNTQLDRPSYYEIEFEVPNPGFVLREGLRGMITFCKQERNAD